jgi:transposase
MKRFIEGENRSQSVFFPERLDDYIDEDNPVRAIDVFVDELDLKSLGFDDIEPEETGRPGYHPATLLKVYIYGYLNRIQSSRRLERETHRNIELVWLTGRLSPDFKTIADFRKDNGPAIRRVCSQFIALCRRLKLFSEALVAIDSSNFKAVNNSDRAFTEGKVRGRLQQLEESIARYLEELDRADRSPSLVTEQRTTHIKLKMRTIKKEMQRLKAIGKKLAEEPDRQLSLTDPDARCMATRSRSSPIVAYNVQTAVDAKHHLIVAHEVTNVGNDRSALSPMAEKARAAMGTEKLTAIADRGYFSGEQILKCEQNGINALVPKSLTSNNHAKGLFDKRDFEYLPKKNEYRCPAGQRAIHRFSTVEHDMVIHKYWSSACPRCPIKSRCTTGDYRRITRWEHEAVVDAAQRRLNENPWVSKVRRQTAEHPFGTLKAWMGSAHFLTRTLPRVSTEMSLHVLAYNMKRLLQMFGTQPLMQMMRT